MMRPAGRWNGTSCGGRGDQRKEAPCGGCQAGVPDPEVNRGGGGSHTHGFGNSVYDELKRKGYQVFPINRAADTIKGEKCYHSLSELPAPVGGVLTCVPPAETRKVVEDCAKLGIKGVWMQYGSQSSEAIEFCKAHGIQEIHSACILMYARPVGFHKFHRVVWKLIGKY